MIAINTSFNTSLAYLTAGLFYLVLCRITDEVMEEHADLMSALC